LVAGLFDDTLNTIVQDVINDREHQPIRNFRTFLDELLGDDKGDLENHLSELYNQDDSDDIFSALIDYLQKIFSLASRKGNLDPLENNYIRLLQLMLNLRNKKTWSCISFNYDTLLEQSYLSTGRDRTRDFLTLENYSDVCPRILKMHGGFNFRYQFAEIAQGKPKTERELFHLMMSQKADSFNNHALIGLKSEIPDHYSAGSHWNATKGTHEPTHQYNFPLIMIPIHATKKPENHYFVDMLSKAKNEIESSTLIIAIGYNFGDESFCNEIKKIDLSKKELILVSTSKLYEDPENHIGFKNAFNVWKTSKISLFKGDGFSKFVTAIMKKVRYPRNSN
jgi:hypothetical protein